MDTNVIKYNIFVAMSIGNLYNKCIELNLPPFSCIAFYHKGEQLTYGAGDFGDPMDTKTTKLRSIEYFDFITKCEIPVDYEINSLLLEQLTNEK